MDYFTHEYIDEKILARLPSSQSRSKDKERISSCWLLSDYELQIGPPIDDFFCTTPKSLQ